jgi:hypothetical protein
MTSDGRTAALLATSKYQRGGVYASSAWLLACGVTLSGCASAEDQKAKLGNQTLQSKVEYFALGQCLAQRYERNYVYNPQNHQTIRAGGWHDAPAQTYRLGLSNQMAFGADILQTVDVSADPRGAGSVLVIRNKKSVFGTDVIFAHPIATEIKECEQSLKA